MKSRLVILFLLGFFNAQSQAITFYPFTNFFSVSTNPEKIVWLDARFQMNSTSNALSTEVSPMISLSRRAYTSTYFGGGVKFNYLNSLGGIDVLEGYYINLGFRATPFEKKMKNAQIVFELSPFVGKNLNYGNFRANLGLGYVFRKKSRASSIAQ
jgi:hypothetical protein